MAAKKKPVGPKRRKAAARATVPAATKKRAARSRKKAAPDATAKPAALSPTSVAPDATATPAALLPKKPSPSKPPPRGWKQQVAESFRPGPHVGEQTPADDLVPAQILRRSQVFKEGARGRTEPRRYKQPSRRRRAWNPSNRPPTS